MSVHECSRVLIFAPTQEANEKIEAAKAAEERINEELIAAEEQAQADGRVL